MSSYVITGASRGIGFEFLRQLSADPENTVIGLVRDVKSAEAKVASELNRSNVHILQGDLNSYESLKKASEATAEITGGKLDYLIANAARLSHTVAYDTFGELADNPALMEEEVIAEYKTNVIGNIHLFNLFIPLILKGQKKKVIFLSSGHADLDVISKWNIDISGIYSLAKAGTNVVVAKYSAEYAKEGVLFMSLSPGVVDTGNFVPAGLNEKQMQNAMATAGKFKEYAPHFEGPVPPAESVKAMISVYEKASVANGDGGSFVSHFGNKQWI